MCVCVTIHSEELTSIHMKYRSRKIANHRKYIQSYWIVGTEWLKLQDDLMEHTISIHICLVLCPGFDSTNYIKPLKFVFVCVCIYHTRYSNINQELNDFCLICLPFLTRAVSKKSWFHRCIQMLRTKLAASIYLTYILGIQEFKSWRVRVLSRWKKID